MKTSKKQISENIGARLTLFPEDFLANHTVTLGSEEARKMTVTSGQRCSELFARYNHVSSWAKMLLDCLVGTTEWYSTKLLLTWKMKDMRHKRFLFQLVPRMPHTEEIEFGLLPNSNNGDMTGAAKMMKGATHRSSGQVIQKTLTMQVHQTDDKNGINRMEGITTYTNNGSGLRDTVQSRRTELEELHDSPSNVAHTDGTEQRNNIGENIGEEGEIRRGEEGNVFGELRGDGNATDTKSQTGNRSED
jgi:hypothetical protein